MPLADITVLEMAHRGADAARGAALVEQPRFAILMRSARRKSRLGVGHIELIAMISWVIRSVTALLFLRSRGLQAFEGQ